jgi:hypothetical protein
MSQFKDTYGILALAATTKKTLKKKILTKWVNFLANWKKFYTWLIAKLEKGCNILKITDLMDLMVFSGIAQQ